jgi:catechol 2,3-dioxygenase-like lactoylglutathione lyase family enzyme
VSGRGSSTDETGLSRAHLRVARPTDHLEAVVEFYRDGLGLEVLDRFTGHDGFDGVMLGPPGGAYHLEFTRKAGHVAGRAPTEDNLLVFYLPDRHEWARAVARLEQAGHRPVPAFNPYWDRSGRTFVDPDGYRVVLYQGSWPGGGLSSSVRTSPEAEAPIRARARPRRPGPVQRSVALPRSSRSCGLPREPVGLGRVDSFSEPE